MAKSKEQFPESEESKESDIESEVKTNPEAGLEAQPEVRQESEQEKEQKLESLEEEIEGIIEEDLTPELAEGGGEEREEKIAEYQKRYLPKHLRKKAGLVSKALSYFWSKTAKFKTEQKENLPKEGPFLVIANHFGGGDAEALMQTFKDFDLHFGIAKEVWWNSSGIIRWFLKKLRTIPVEESLSNISEEEKEESLKRQGKQGKRAFRKIIDREKEGRVPVNTEFVRQAVALLSRGDAVAIFPEGLWLEPSMGFPPREKAEMKQGYAGFELIARQYNKLTGKDLPIVPTAFIEDREAGKKKLVIGESLSVDDNKTELSNTDWSMSHVAKMLPENQRGYYKEMVENLE